jgi:hypothetical protein
MVDGRLEAGHRFRHALYRSCSSTSEGCRRQMLERPKVGGSRKRRRASRSTSSREPLVRLRLWRVDEEEHLFLVTMHHIVSDGWSLGIFIRELAAVYAAYADDRPVLLAPLSIQYAEFAHWQRQWLHDASLRDQLAYWKLQLRGPLRTRELPTDRPRRYGLIARTARESFALPRALFEELAALSQRADGTLFMTVLAGFEILLHGYTGEEDMRVATFVANRQSARDRRW